MGIWLLSRLLSYCTVVEFFDYVAEFSARHFVTVRSYITPSQYVDIADSTFPVVTLILYEILLLIAILGLFVLGYKLAKKGEYSFPKMLNGYGKFLFCLGAWGVFSRLLTVFAIVWFLDSRYIFYEALDITTARDVIYLLLGILLPIWAHHLQVSTKSSGEKRGYFSVKKILKILFVIVFLFSIFFNLIFLASGIGMYMIYNEQYGLILEEQNEIKELNNKLIRYKSQNSSLEDKNKQLEEIVDFFYEHVAFVVDDNTRFYHTYDCAVFQDADSFWAYNIAAAKGEGYKPCIRCH